MISILNKKDKHATKMKQFCCLPHVSSLIRTKVCRKGKRKVSLIPSFNWLNKKEIRGGGGWAPQRRRASKEVQQQSQTEYKGGENRWQGKEWFQRPLFKPLISHSHKELWGRFILFTFLLHLFSVILQCSVSYMGEGVLPGEESAPFTAL